MGERARILVVDDDEGIRRTLASVLGDEYIVDTAESGKEAIARSKAESYNLALIDIRLPDIEGTELLSRIRDTTPRIRAIVITGYPTIPNAMEAVNRRADAYVLKPFKMEEVLEIIREQIKKQREDEKYSEERVTDFIETRAKELETSMANEKSQ